MPSYPKLLSKQFKTDFQRGNLEIAPLEMNSHENFWCHCLPQRSPSRGISIQHDAELPPHNELETINRGKDYPRNK